MESTKKLKKIKIISVLVITVLFILISYITYRANYLQVLEIGEEYLITFEQRTKYRIQLFGISFLLLFCVFFITNIFIRKGLKVFFDDEKKELPKLPNKSISFILALIFSAMITITFLDQLILFINTAWFGTNDPIFGLDIGFFLFQKPFIVAIITYYIKLLCFLVIYKGAYYIIVFNRCLNGVDKNTLLKSKFIKGLKINVFLIVIGIAILVFFSTFDIVTGEFVSLKNTLSTSIIGAGLSDSMIKLWGYRILSIIIIISSIFILKYISKNELKKLFISISIVPIYLVIMFVILVITNIYVKSNVFDKEKEYIRYNLAYTKQAYNLNIEETEYANAENISKEILEDNQAIVKNIRLIDEDTTLKTLNGLQTNSGYYAYTNTKLQQYNLNGENTLVYISPREMNTSNSASTYQNKTYQYTHGYGNIITYASQVDETGNVKYIQKGFEEKDNRIAIQEPRIYFGMQTNHAVVTNASQKAEFDYPITATKSAEYGYQGKAGLQVGFLDRLILSIANKEVKITFSSVDENSKILFNRNIIKRAKTIIPDLKYEEKPYLIISDEGRQIWVLDAYTTSDAYPYSQKTPIASKEMKKEINYIRNSIKVLIDAYDGTVDFYLMDKTDPIANAYQNAYPDVLKDGDLIETSISSHFIYPEYLYKVQSEILKIYHNVTDDVLYRGDDVWNYATFNANTKTTSGTLIEPYYTMVKTNEGTNVGLVVPYIVEGKQNINSYLIGTVQNGKLNLQLYQFSSGSNVLGPKQLDREIEEDETIASELESINVTGTKITKNIIIVPIHNSLLYVEPIYQQQLNEKNAIPLLKKVVVASGNKVAIGDNLQVALEKLVSQSAVAIQVESNDTLENLINAVIEANNNLKESTRSQDFEMIGKDITKLQELIDQLETEEKNNKQEETVKEIDKQEDKVNNTVDNIIK